MKKILSALVFFLACAPVKSTAQWLFAQNAVFISVEGQVTVQDAKGMTRSAKKDSEVYEGETVVVAADSRALLRFFDGSTVELRPHTRLAIASLKHPADKQKEIRFALISGWVLAKVQKLATASSLFEIEAGGVVCGVRGTQFSVAYEPTGGKVDLKVMEGTVYAKSGGRTHLLNAGEEMEFNHGDPSANTGPNKKFAIREMVPELKVAQTLPLGLMDLSSQFQLGLSVNGSVFGSSPMVSGAVQTGIHLSSVGTPSLLNGLPLLNGFRLKLP
jgi:hypothetical protein